MGHVVKVNFEFRHMLRIHSSYILGLRLSDYLACHITCKYHGFMEYITARMILEMND